MGELQQLQPDDESKQKMLDILKRLHSEEEEDMDNMEEDESGSVLSEETVQKIISGSQISLDDLSLEEQKHFQRAIASGELSKLIKPWEPWWLRPAAKHICLSQEGTQLVQPLMNNEQLVSSQNDIESEQSNGIPPGPEDPLPPIKKLSAADPSPLLAVHLIDIIYSYCFTLRLYNGDWLSDPAGSSLVLLSISSVLGQGGQPQTVLEALSHCLEQTCSPGFRHMGGLQFGLGLMDDIISILNLGTAAIVCSLCDLRRLIQAGARELKKSGKSGRTERKTKLRSAEKKVYFITCWVHEQQKEVWSSLAALVVAEKSSALEYVGNGRKFSRIEEKVKAKEKPLILEIQ